MTIVNSSVDINSLREFSIRAYAPDMCLRTRYALRREGEFISYRSESYIEAKGYIEFCRRQNISTNAYQDPSAAR